MVNFLMDMLLLSAHRRILGYTATYSRVVASATLGAFWACIVEVGKFGNTFIGKVCTYIFIAAIMVKICAGKCNVKRWIRDTFIFYAIAAMFGGVCHMVMYYTRAGYWIQTVILSNQMLVISLFWSVVLIAVIEHYINVKRIYEQKMYRVMIVIKGRKTVIKGFYDTGNVLKDPFVLKPVHIVEEKSLETILEEIEDYTQVKMHMVPFSSMGCESGILKVITADLMYIYYNDEVRIIKEPLIGLTNQRLSQDGAYEMLINGSTF